MGSYNFCIAVLVMFNLSFMGFSASLNPYFYAKVCPQALPTIKRIVGAAVKQERRMGASLLRLHFHDCFVNGCDASILLDSTSAFTSEKNALPNANSARGFEVIDRTKYEVDKVCGCPVVSCADILAVAARDSVVAVPNDDIPSPSMDLPALINSFKKQGLNVKDLVALSGGHTLGLSQCGLFKDCIYNKTNIDPNFARQRRATCPPNGGDSNLAPLDPTPASFETKYFSNLVSKKGLLHSDQALYNGGQTDYLVKTYSKNFGAFSKDFSSSMIKMGNIKPLTGKRGQIRLDCKKVN
ncbi:Hypothetical predicted protein [Olea europaea subsp. europaea]|uniref:Peroxidase n=1 Tax=Olea europaea subsp. europaea TaxID=158383 RepID=A0A8S0S1N8_OLEEU|nr:Hypothetical predicted protein [Olea europaea subsp. europaea]